MLKVNTFKRVYRLISLSILSLVSACVLQQPNNTVTLPQALEKTGSYTSATEALFSSESDETPPASTPNQARQHKTPSTNVEADRIGDGKSNTPPLLGKKGVVFSAENLPLSQFISEVFGNILGLNFEIDQALKARPDQVTLRIPQKVTKKKLYQLAVQVLDRYGIVIQNKDGLLRFVISNPEDSSIPPLLISGRTLPNVPGSHRTIFHFVPLKVINQNVIANWLRKVYDKAGLQIEGDMYRNGLLLNGPQRIVRQAIEAVELLDRPSFRGKYSARFELFYQAPESVISSLQQILKTEGYSLASADGIGGSITLLPLKYLNSLLVFAADKKSLSHIGNWIRNLDQTPKDVNKNNVYYYEVRNTRADGLVDTLNKLLGKGNALIKTDNNGQAVSTAPMVPASQRIVLDETRNAIVFQGDADEWRTIREVLRKMDRPIKQVLAEVTIAEITLTDAESFGFEWLLRVGNLSLTGGGNGGALNYVLDNAGQTQLALNALATNQRVSILSTPRILVKSGESAKIDVGSEVPIVTSEENSSTQTNGNTNLVRQVQYRKTGVLLSVTPVIHSGNRVDLKVQQEVSEAQTNTTSNISSPSIFTRSVDTSVTLKDGGSVMLAGLMTSSTNTGKGGVPVLMDVPVFGELFKSEQYQTERKELIILIRPYIIENDEDAYSLTRSQQERLSMFALPTLASTSTQSQINRLPETEFLPVTEIEPNDEISVETITIDDFPNIGLTP